MKPCFPSHLECSRKNEFLKTYLENLTKDNVLVTMFKMITEVYTTGKSH